MSAFPFVWAIQSLVRFSGCPHRTWLLVNAVFCVGHVLVAIDLAYKVNIDYGSASHGTLEEDGYVMTTVDPAESHSDPKMMETTRNGTPTATTTPPEECDYVHMDRGAASGRSLMHIATYNPVWPPSLDKISSTPANSFRRLITVEQGPPSVCNYRRWFLVVYLIWIYTVPLDIGSNKDNIHADCEQITHWTQAASLLGLGYLRVIELLIVMTWIYTCYNS